MARDDTDKFFHTKCHYGDDPNLFKKGVYPYAREKFYSQLNEEGISEEQYDRALEMWRRYDCKTLKDYHNIYLILDLSLIHI